VKGTACLQCHGWFPQQRGNRYCSWDCREKASSVHSRAYRAVKAAQKSGQLMRPVVCESCSLALGKTRLLVGHHDDYSKPLSIRWLCPACHRRHHATEVDAREAAPGAYLDFLRYGTSSVPAKSSASGGMSA
jgi:hypothetical protein